MPALHLSAIDWSLIVAYLIISFLIAWKFSGKAGKNLGEFFLGGRRLPWWILGVSMVATTFAADTPLAVTELVAQSGISGNWLWWNMLIGGMLTTFFFARLWRRANVLTEVELIRLRYGGKPARFLRGFKSVYLGFFLNILVICWVNIAFQTLLRGFFGFGPDSITPWLLTGAAMLLVAFYSSLSGLVGVALTDLLQFVIAMAGSIVLAIVVLNSPEVGGIEGLKSSLGENSGAFDFFPKISGSSVGTGILGLSLGAFIAHIGMQWWASWYPGAEPGGGGYIAQRMLSAKNEKHSVLATLFFQIGHYCLRPWPWIIVGLCAVSLYSFKGNQLPPQLEQEIVTLKSQGVAIDELGKHIPNYADLTADPAISRAIEFAYSPKQGYVWTMLDFLPNGLKGLLLVAFFAAFMSTISTQLNWGASYLVNDLYKPFIRKEQHFSDPATAQKHYVGMSRWATLLLMLAAWGLTRAFTSITDVWVFMVECGAGLGLVLILRWFWWRINVWSEITATILPILLYGFFKLGWGAEVALGRNPVFYFLIIGITTIGWIVATFLTKPEKQEILEGFYQQVRPGGFWKKISRPMGLSASKNKTGWLLLSWASAVIMTYSLLFATGKFIFQFPREGLGWLLAAGVSIAVFVIAFRKTEIMKNT